MLGHRDLKLSIKLKREEFYKRVSVEYFGKLPGFNFTNVKELTPGSPEGKKRYSSDEEEIVTTRKRNMRSESSSPQQPLTTKPRVDDISHDDADTAWDGF